MGGACGRYGGEGKHIQILEGKMKEIDHLEDLGTDRRIISQ